MARRRGYLEEIKFEKRRRRQRKLIFMSASFLALFLAGIYSLFYSGFFSIDSLEVNEYKDIDKSSLDELINNYLDEKVFFGLIPRRSNFILVSKKYLEGKIEDTFVQLEKVNTDLAFFSKTISVDLEKRETAGIWCFKSTEKCLYFDKQGFLFQEAGDSFKKENILTVVDENKTSRYLRDSVSDREMLDKIIESDKVLKILDFIGYLAFYIPENSFSDFYIKTSEGWDIYMDKTVNIEDQFFSLRELLNKKISSEKRNSLKYMDLRIQGRVYYK